MKNEITHIPIRYIYQNKTRMIIDADEDMNKLGHSDLAGENVKWYSHF